MGHGPRATQEETARTRVRVCAARAPPDRAPRAASPGARVPWGRIRSIARVPRTVDPPNRGPSRACMRI